jgi:hypothetical protein
VEPHQEDPAEAQHEILDPASRSAWCRPQTRLEPGEHRHRENELKGGGCHSDPGEQRQLEPPGSERNAEAAERDHGPEQREGERRAGGEPRSLDGWKRRGTWWRVMETTNATHASGAGDP